MSLRPNRKPNRLPNFDYDKNGEYFITVCAESRREVFGKVANGEMILNECGEIAKRWWLELKNKFSDVYFDEFVIMPNHIHAIIIISVGTALCGCPEKTGRPRGVAPTISSIVGWFKTMVANEYIRNVKTKKWPRFEKSFWQRSFYDHIINTEEELSNIRQYILDNPRNWELDKDNLENLKM